MTLLLDTHVLLWWLEDDPGLGTNLRAAVASPDNLVYVSAATIWEIAIKRSIGKVEIPPEWAESIAAEPFRSLPITRDHAAAVEQLPQRHRDPFDRMLVAQAQRENLVLVTRDERIRQYEVQTLPD